MSEFAQIAFLIHHGGVEEVVDGGALAMGGFLEKLANRW